MTSSNRQRLVMVVEDDFTIRETLRDALELDGYHVQTAVNGQDALDRIDRGPKPDLILLDLMMPVMDGRSFLDHVEKEPELSRIPVVVISATADEVSSRGAAAFLKKPPDLDRILELVAKFTVP